MRNFPLRVILAGGLCILVVAATLSYSMMADASLLRVVVAGILLGGAYALTLYALCRLLALPPSPPENALITALILFLLCDPSASLWAFPVVGATTGFIQQMMRTSTGPLLNPAAAGLFVSSIAGLVVTTWWGTSFAPRFNLFGISASSALLVTLPVGLLVAYRYRKIPSVGTTIGAFVAGYFALFGTFPTYILLDGTLLFFLLVMVPEPKTSPILRSPQILYGACVGILLALGLRFNAPSALLASLLTGNIVWRFLKR